jgi:glutathionylspermidine synthase
MLLEYCKWDPQVGDVSTLADFPLLIGRSHWDEICRIAEALAAELSAAEAQLLRRPDLHRALAIPRWLRQALRAALHDGPTPAAVRVLRFDFHWTTEGWRISEVNSDVPGGFAEASEFPRLVAAGCDAAASPAGDPASAWAAAVAQAAGTGGSVALLAAAGFMEDLQVVSFMARRLSERGLTPHIASPSQLDWRDGRAHLRTAWCDGPVAAVVRFFQVEWLARLPRNCRWRPLIAGGRTRVTNPGSAVLTESKRFPLVWNGLTVPLPTWRRLLPESRDPRDARWRSDDGWLLKTALCNTGDTVAARDLVPPKRWRTTCRSAWLRPGQWVAQRRFETLPVPTPMGDVYPCIGVYTIDGRACGAYTRIATRPVIDYRAIDMALLVESEGNQGLEEERA